MRKILSSILVLTMVLSLFSMSVGAEHWAQDAIDFVTENGYWIASTPIEPDRAATRAETASLFAKILFSENFEYVDTYADVSRDNLYSGDIAAVTANGLMQGYAESFRPDDTLTREELACILDRAAKQMSDNYRDQSYVIEKYKDSEDISDWALQSVKNATHNVLMKGKGFKVFDAQGTTTLAEVATVVKNLADFYAIENANTTTYTVRDVKASDNIKKDFEVIQSGGTYSQMNVGGFGMMVRFDETPGDIYVQRIHPENAKLDGYAYPMVMLRIIDPNGDCIVRENMTYKEFGTMEKIINIPNGQPGIYRIQFTGGAFGDICTIGVNNAKSWGVFGDTAFLPTSTTPKTAYFWVPWKYETVCIGVTKGNAKIYTADGKTLVGETADNNEPADALVDPTLATVDLKELTPDTVYRVDLPEDFTGAFDMIGGSRVICPTPEMAADLKGGYILYEDEFGTFQCAGPLQVRARQRMVEIYKELDGDFTVDVTAPVLKGSAEEYDNILAEVQLFGKYHGSVEGMNSALYKQVLDPANPWFGCFMAKDIIDGKKAYPDPTWEHGYYYGQGGYRGRDAFVGALTINAETNAYYANPTLQKRLELMYLTYALQMTNCGDMLFNNPDRQAAYYYALSGINFEFGKCDAASGYKQARNWLSPETRVLTDNAMQQYAEWVMSNMGAGCFNQSYMCIEGALSTYLWTGEQYFLDYFEDAAAGCVYPCTMGNYVGMNSPLGYLNEGSGSDGSSYAAMSEFIFFTAMFDYITQVPDEYKDPEKRAKIMEGIDRAIGWSKLWYLPGINGFGSYRPNIYTSRTEPGSGATGSEPGIILMMPWKPIVKRLVQVNVAGSRNPFTYDEAKWVGTNGQMAVNDIQAYKRIEEVFSKEYGGSLTSQGAVSALPMWTMHHLPQYYEDSEIERLPFEVLGDYNIMDPDGGAIALKHKGLYLTSFYNNDLDGRMSSISWLPAAPVQVWDEYFGSVLCSMKPYDWQNRTKQPGPGMSGNDLINYTDRFAPEDVYHTGIVGNTADKGILIEGKALNEIKWFDDKSFEIRGTDPFHKRDMIWQYYMTDEGMTFKAGMDSVSANDDLWVQLAVIDPSKTVEGSQLIYEDGSLAWEHEGKTLTISWDKSIKSELVEKPNAKANYKFLRLKLTPEKPMVEFSFTRNVGDYEFFSGYEYNFQ